MCVVWVDRVSICRITTTKYPTTCESVCLVVRRNVNMGKQNWRGGFFHNKPVHSVNNVSVVL